MEIKELKPRKALNKAFLKVKPNRTEIEGFKTNLLTLLDRTNDTESEEFHKNLVSDFLKDTYYKQNHFINTKGRNDLVIHNGQNASSTVGVILEAKKPTNRTEMITTKKLNTKAFQELVLYYLRERITHKNLEVKHLVATNINEWFIFDASLFDRLFAQNKNLVKQFNDFEEGRLADTKTDFFYKQIAEPFVSSISSEIEFTYFNIQDFQTPLRNTDKGDDKSLIALFKLLSPEHLLKLPFTNDSNSLDKRFYTELLHIIGLNETKDGGKKLIERNNAGERHTGTILEDAIIQLDSLDKLSRLAKPSQYGNTQEERLFNVALELSITWINRILFLKLLEAQLITYHKGDKSYSFLNLEKIKNYDDLNSLFFQVLARKYDDRNEDVKKIFEKVPYLNSSLFEPTDMEQVTLFISNLRDDKFIPVISSTVLKDNQGKKRTGSLTTLEYLFEFLNAYDFSSEGSEEIQEDNKTLINASVLGLIFEKINGYKDGSFFTPGFITMYMCRETIRKAVVQKFNETKKWDCIDIEGLYDKIEDRKEANNIVNSIKICDPAVGSGHFLVSALNEMIAVKNDLKILQDRDGKRLKEYQVEVVNDELIVTDEEGELFEYNPNNKESQRIQEMLFHEKQSIIENCLFGVDINSNSVKICRLRLWIELLKNAYYKNNTELETLPNIDINIKCGNSLVSRFAIDADLKQALKKSKWTIDSYRIAVDTYRNAENKEQKREMERLITDIKSDFRSEISLNDPKAVKYRKVRDELFNMTNQVQLFELGKKEKADWNKKVNQLTEETKKLETEIEEIKANKIFENAFEWRFEFPEVLNDDGDFVGFDVVIGNPPYVPSNKIELQEKRFLEVNFITSEYQINTFGLFAEKGVNLLKSNGLQCFIIPNYWLSTKYNNKLRQFLFIKNYSYLLVNTYSVFDSAVVDTLILFTLRSENNNKSIQVKSVDRSHKSISERLDAIHSRNWSYEKNYTIDASGDDLEISFDQKITPKGNKNLGEYFIFKFGAKLYEVGKGTPPQTKESAKSHIYESPIKTDTSYIELLRARDIKRFRKAKSNYYVKYGENLAAPRNKDIFLSPRILVNRIIGKSYLDASIESTFKISNTDVIILLPKHNDVDLYYFLGLIGSKYIAYVLKSTNVNLDRNAFPKINTETLGIFPIPENPELQLKICNAVKYAFEIQNNEFTILSNQIDQLVYKLYDLTEEEIQIIENA